jgi:hypothetical protein
MKANTKIATMTLSAMIAGGSLAEPAPLTNEPRTVPPSAIGEEAKVTKETIALLGMAEEFLVKGTTAYGSHLLAAKKIVFEPNATLVFSDSALGNRNNLIIAAEKIVMADPNNPGTITWAKGIAATAGNALPGQGAAGRHGAQNGESGGPGTAGAQGAVGKPGRNAPNLTLFVTRFEGNVPLIDLSGQDGGKGAPGQKGGDGGVGQQGVMAASRLHQCERSVGWGGKGGDGGSGGKGGTGGAGGAGGTATLASLPDAFPPLLQLLRVNVAGGAAGIGGDAGPGGNGGPGGAPGEPAFPWCKEEPERRGAAGATGAPGPKGDPGVAGISGDVMFTTLEQQNFARIFGN